jgi:5'-3' exonuclease
MKKTLLIDGNNLFTIGFHGVREFYSEGKHIGGVFHFLNTIRLFLDKHNHDKVVVFWDGAENSLSRKEIYPKYKENRIKPVDDYKYESYLYQRERVKQYLEEIFVRQCIVEQNEADDLIAYYTKIATDETIIILSGDKDLTQLVSKNVTVFSPTSKSYIKNGDLVEFKDVKIPHSNIFIYKVIIGDKSDNIDGVLNFGEKKLKQYFPNVEKNAYTLEQLLIEAKEHYDVKPNKSLSNLINGVSKSGLSGDEFYAITGKIIDLKNPLITNLGIEAVNEVYVESIDPTDRSYKNLVRFMSEDGFFKFLPKKDDAWVDFVRPFMKLSRKEKKIIN